MLKRKYKKIFINYVKGLTIDEEVKKIIISDEFIENNPEFYLYYPLLFSVYFEIDESELEMLCIAGYLYYQATIFLDKVIDDKQQELLFFVMVCQEEAVKILTTIFPINSDFWVIWNKRKIDYKKTIFLEKTIHQKPNYQIYSELAILKSTFGNCAIDGMFFLDKNKFESEYVYEILLKTHDYFSIAYQLNDDILDFVNDYKKHQFNWCIYNFEKEYLKKYSIEDCKKIFYIEGLCYKNF